MENYVVINGVKVELTSEQIRIIEENVNKNKIKETWNPGNNDKYFYIDEIGNVSSSIWVGGKIDEERLSSSNCCKDEKIIRQHAKDRLLNNMLWKYSLIHGWEGDASCADGKKYFAEYDSKTHKWGIRHVPVNRSACGVVYFVDEKTAYNAIKDVIIPYETEEHCKK